MMGPGLFRNKELVIPLGDLEREIRIFLNSWKETDHAVPSLYHGIIDTVERVLIEKALTAAARNQVRASQLLGINRITLRNKIKKYNLV